MPWKQLIVLRNLRQVFNDPYDVSSLPDMLFIDAHGKLI